MSRVNGKRAVYTCLFGYSEHFSDFKLDGGDDIDFVCFTDNPDIKSTFWTIVQVPPSILDPSRQSKMFKHNPHLLFPNHLESLYIDNTIRLNTPVSSVFDNYMDARTLLVAFTHPWRDCVYEEARALDQIGYDNSNIINRQMSFYRTYGYPENNGLNATGILLRRHSDPHLMETMATWNADLLRFSKRDQLSFNVAVWKHKLPVSAFPGSLLDNPIMTWIRDMKRLPRDFDDARYLALHPDVAMAKTNPRRHFLNHGIDQGRAYK